MPTAGLSEIRLTAFKSYHDVVLPIGPLTVLTGRNSSGKSNALDAVDVLSRLAGGEDLTDALDGRRREGGAVRGGSAGCAPHGATEFSLGCTVQNEAGRFHLDVTIQVAPELRIVREELRGPAPALRSGVVDQRDLLVTREPEADTATLFAEIYNGKRGRNPPIAFRDSRLLTAQLPLRLGIRNAADQAVVDGALAVTSALLGVFHLDPVPHLMRGYVPERDADLRRTGENLSAVVARLAGDDAVRLRRLEQLAGEVSDNRIDGVETTRSEFGDVMLAIRENSGDSRGPEVTPAREMSDGLLRFMAVAAALLTPNRALDLDQPLAVEDVTGGVLLVIEELENGLHPSMAGRVLELITEVSDSPAKQVILTTHSPALLNAMTGAANDRVFVCYSDDDGSSRISRLTELAGYAEAIARGRLGDAVSRDQLTRPMERDDDFTEFDRLLGIS